MTKTQKERPKCIHPDCSSKAKNKGRTKKGSRIWAKYCKTHHNALYVKNERRNIYKLYKKSTCEFCGFIALHSCQLDVDHIDGNHGNNEILNLRTLCANCHRLKTYNNNEGIFKTKGD